MRTSSLCFVVSCSNARAFLRTGHPSPPHLEKRKDPARLALTDGSPWPLGFPTTLVACSRAWFARCCQRRWLWMVRTSAVVVVVTFFMVSVVKFRMKFLLSPPCLQNLPSLMTRSKLNRTQEVLNDFQERSVGQMEAPRHQGHRADISRSGTHHVFSVLFYVWKQKNLRARRNYTWELKASVSSILSYGDKLVVENIGSLKRTEDQ